MFNIIWGIIDLVGSILLVLASIQFHANMLLLVPIAVILLLKALYSLKESSYVVMFIDGIAAAFLLLTAVSVYTHPAVYIIISVFLVIKAFNSILKTLTQ